MLKAYHHYFLLNGIKINANNYDPNLLKSGISIYEVMRCINGKELFLDEHLERLENSSKKLKFDIWHRKSEIVEAINTLKEINDVRNGNIEIIFHQSERGKHFICLFIEDRYPSVEMYQNGVESSLFEAERFNPTAKRINIHLREKTIKNINENDVFEIVLVDRNAHITEGSRSNLFFVKDDELYTADATTVLPGIMRQKILDICETNNIKVHETRIPVNDIESFDAAFFTGTSPKAIAISNIGDLKFDVQNNLMNKVIGIFDDLIEDYLK